MQYLIGQLADKCNVNKETIRYYERKGLISSAVRSQIGNRLNTYLNTAIDMKIFPKTVRN